MGLQDFVRLRGGKWSKKGAADDAPYIQKCVGTLVGVFVNEPFPDSHEKDFDVKP